jgi:hypothetical protein
MFSCRVDFLNSLCRRVISFDYWFHSECRLLSVLCVYASEHKHDLLPLTSTLIIINRFIKFSPLTILCFGGRRRNCVRKLLSASQVFRILKFIDPTLVLKSRHPVKCSLPVVLYDCPLCCKEWASKIFANKGHKENICT